MSSAQNGDAEGGMSPDAEFAQVRELASLQVEPA